MTAPVRPVPRCPNGHPLAGANRYQPSASHSPRCRQCNRDAALRYKRRRRGQEVDEADVSFERQLLLLAANGATDQEIATRTGASLNRVHWAWRRIKNDLGARDRTHAVVLSIRARRIGLGDVPPAVRASKPRQKPQEAA